MHSSPRPDPSTSSRVIAAGISLVLFIVAAILMWAVLPTIPDSHGGLPRYVLAGFTALLFTAATLWLLAFFYRCIYYSAVAIETRGADGFPRISKVGIAGTNLQFEPERVQYDQQQDAAEMRKEIAILAESIEELEGALAALTGQKS